MNTFFEKTDELYYQPKNHTGEYLRLTDAIVRVFRRYPYFAGSEPSYLESIFYLDVGLHNTHPDARVYSLSREFDDVAIWYHRREEGLPLSRKMRYLNLPGGPRSLLHGLPSALKSSSRHTRRNDRRIRTAWKAVDLPPEHLMLELLMVGEEYRGEGRAGKLLRPLLEQADLHRVPVALDTNTERNVAIYSSYGFEVVDHFTLSTCPSWLMLRQAQG